MSEKPAETIQGARRKRQRAVKKWLMPQPHGSESYLTSSPIPPFPCFLLVSPVFDSMLTLVPSLYYSPPEQDLNTKFTHSKSTSAANARQAIKENSKAGLKTKAKFDPKNYTSVLVSRGERERSQEIESSQEIVLDALHRTYGGWRHDD